MYLSGSSGFPETLPPWPTSHLDLNPPREGPGCTQRGSPLLAPRVFLGGKGAGMTVTMLASPGRGWGEPEVYPMLQDVRKAAKRSYQTSLTSPFAKLPE